MDAPSWLGTVLVSLLSASLGSAVSGLVIWWRQSAVQQAKNDARDAAHQAELAHFRSETEKLFGEMRSVMNGFGQRLEHTAEQTMKLRHTMHGPNDRNGVYGTVRELLTIVAGLTAKVDAALAQGAALTKDLAAVERRLPPAP